MPIALSALYFWTHDERDFGHMTQLDTIAQSLNTNGRTLRRAEGLGMLHARRPSPNKVAVSQAEEHYLLDHWPLLSTLRQALRTEPNVRLAVLYGSVARGDEHLESDIDILVVLRNESLHTRMGLVGRLEEIMGRRVQLVTLVEAEGSPLLLADVIRDGRVLADREGNWPRLLRRGSRIRRLALEQEERIQRDLLDGLRSLGVIE